MTPKEKAVELVDRFKISTSIVRDNEAKRCASICVDEISDVFYYSTPKDDTYCFLMSMEYWQEVKQEIENL